MSFSSFENQPRLIQHFLKVGTQFPPGTTTTTISVYDMPLIRGLRIVFSTLDHENSVIDVKVGLYGCINPNTDGDFGKFG